MFKVIYLSTFIKTRLSTVAPPNTLITFRDRSFTVQKSLDVSVCMVGILAAVKIASQIIPMRSSVTDKHPIMVLLGIVFSRGFVLTAMITNAFKNVVTGEVIMLLTIKIGSTP